MTTRPIYFCILTALFPLATAYAQSPAVLQVGSFDGIDSRPQEDRSLTVAPPV
jgi:hypothetical protein